MAYSSQIKFHKIRFPSEIKNQCNKYIYKSIDSCNDSRSWSMDQLLRSQKTYDDFFNMIEAQNKIAIGIYFDWMTAEILLVLINKLFNRKRKNE